MHRPHKDSAKGNPKERHRTITRSENSTEDGSRTCYVEQLDKERAPTWHRHIIDTIIEFCAWHFGFCINLADLFEVFAVGEVCYNEQYMPRK